MSSYIFSEPHPSATPSGLTHSGRGGAGNISISKSSSSARPVKVPRQTGRFYTGIGGAGNVHAASERQPMSFEEDFERARAREAATAGHIGVGGAGNVFYKSSAPSNSSSDESRRGSEGSGFWGRLSMSKH